MKCGGDFTMSKSKLNNRLQNLKMYPKNHQPDCFLWMKPCLKSQEPGLDFARLWEHKVIQIQGR